MTNPDSTQIPCHRDCYGFSQTLVPNFRGTKLSPHRLGVIGTGLVMSQELWYKFHGAGSMAVLLFTYQGSALSPYLQLISPIVSQQQLMPDSLLFLPMSLLKMYLHISQSLGASEACQGEKLA